MESNVGVGLADEMIKETYAGNGKVYPAYGFKNDRNYQRIQPSNAINILIGMKAGNSSIKKNDGSPATPISAINGNAYTRINSGKVRFLIKEQEAKSALLATKVGQKMTPKQRIERLMPHTLTTKLFDEMANLRLKPNTVEVTVERINAHKPKDKFSALSYGLWRIKELEDEYSRTYKRRGRKRKLIFYN